jgi:hypothetical protein
LTQPNAKTQARKSSLGNPPYNVTLRFFQRALPSQLTLTTVATQTMFDEDAGVFDHEEACGAGFVGSVLVFDSLLHPDNFCADGDGAVNDRRNVFGTAENIDNFDVLRFWDVFEARVGFYAENLAFVGIYGNDAVASGLYILSDAETGAAGIR